MIKNYKIGNINKPRMCIFRSNKHFSVQFIDDSKSHTTFSFNTINFEGNWKNNIEKIGSIISNSLQEKGIKAAFFDRGNLNKFRKTIKYKGVIKNFIESLRINGIKI